MTIDLDELKQELDRVAPGDESSYYLRGRSVCAAREGQGVTLVVARVWIDSYGVEGRSPRGPLSTARRCFELAQIGRRGVRTGRTDHFHTLGEALAALRAKSRGEAVRSTFEPR
jgi:hypothetical protein